MKNRKNLIEKVKRLKEILERRFDDEFRCEVRLAMSIETVALPICTEHLDDPLPDVRTEGCCLCEKESEPWYRQAALRDYASAVWQPIETAPVDEWVVVGRVLPGGGPRLVMFAHKRKDGTWEDFSEHGWTYPEKPSHWMKIPPIPEGGIKKENP